MDIRKRLIITFSVLLAILACGSTGYYFIMEGKESFIDCMYMTVITLTTVGYREVVDVQNSSLGKIFTMLLAAFGMGVLLYAFSIVTAFVVEGELSDILRRKRMEKDIKKLRGHYIVCGAGEIGYHVIEELTKNLCDVVLIDTDAERIKKCESLGQIYHIKGDATDDQALIAAGIEEARGIIIALPSDKDNLYTTVTARMIHPTIRIVVKSVEEQITGKLKKAGADAVISPYMIGGLRIASVMLRPSVVDFLDEMLRDATSTLRVEEIEVKANSKLAGKSIKDMGLKEDFNLLVVAARDKAAGKMIFNPKADFCAQEGTVLVVMGSVHDVKEVREIA
jgi:voltage-gated potassium channel